MKSLSVMVTVPAVATQTAPPWEAGAVALEEASLDDEIDGVGVAAQVDGAAEGGVEVLVEVVAAVVDEGRSR